jgi:hypothetical protein
MMVMVVAVVFTTFLAAQSGEEADDGAALKKKMETIAKRMNDTEYPCVIKTVTMGCTDQESCMIWGAVMYDLSNGSIAMTQAYQLLSKFLYTDRIIAIPEGTRCVTLKPGHYGEYDPVPMELIDGRKVVVFAGCVKCLKAKKK